MEDGLTVTANPHSDAPFEMANDYQDAGFQVATTSAQLTMKPLTEMTKKVTPTPWAEGEGAPTRPPTRLETVPRGVLLVVMAVFDTCPRVLCCRRRCDADGTVSSDYFAERDPPRPTRLKNLPVIGAKMQEKNAKLKNVDLVNKASHVVLRNM
eukprot:COSAG02_NODE_2215_length_9489_cov_4.810011_7_plen_153_part_00